MTIMARGDKFGVKIKGTDGKQKWIGTFATEALAKQEEAAALRDARRDRETQAQNRPAQITAESTVREYADRFLSLHCRHIQPSTYMTYSGAVNHFVRRYGDRPLSSFARKEAVDWSMGAPRNTRRVVRLMFGKAADDGLLAQNVFHGIAVPTSSSRGRGGDRLVVITRDELDRLVATAEAMEPGPYGEMLGAFFTIAAFTAMRPGEMFALRWDHIDTDKFQVRVAQSRARTGALKAPKNGRERTVAFPMQAVAALRKVPRIDGSPLVFHTKRGKMFSPDAFGDLWRPVRLASGVPIKDVYELRHFCATMLVEANLHDWQVAHQLGHTDNGLLVRSTYFHPDPVSIQDAVLAAFRRAA